MNWKNIMNKNNWVFQQVELIESNVCLENPGRGWYGIYTFVVQDSINPEELRWSLRDGELLALVLLDISIYRSMQLDENALNNIRSILSFFMYYKKDVILRPVYDQGKEKGVNVSRIVLNRCWSIYSRLVVCSGICNIRYSSSRGCLPEAGEKCMIPDICHQSVSIECGTVCGSIWEMRYILLYVLRRSGEF